MCAEKNPVLCACPLCRQASLKLDVFQWPCWRLDTIANSQMQFLRELLFPDLRRPTTNLSVSRQTLAGPGVLIILRAAFFWYPIRMSACMRKGGHSLSTPPQTFHPAPGQNLGLSLSALGKVTSHDNLSLAQLGL